MDGRGDNGTNSKDFSCAPCELDIEDFVTDAVNLNNVIVPDIEFLFHVPSPVICD